MASDRLARGVPRSWVIEAAAAVFILNLLDAALTLHWVHNGLAGESNLLLRHLVHFSPLGFLLGKLAIAGGGCLLLCRFGWHPLARSGLALLLAAYFSVLQLHLFIATENPLRREQLAWVAGLGP